MIQTLFPDDDCIFQNDNAPIHTAHVVQNWYEKDKSEQEHMEWPSQSPDINIIELLWWVLERQVRNRYPPPSSLKELEKILIEEWLKSPVDDVLVEMTKRKSVYLTPEEVKNANDQSGLNIK